MEALGRLAAGVAHDFANLLTLISGYTEMLLHRISQRDPLRPEIEEVRKAANRGAGLTSQLLEFTRGQRPEPKLVDLNMLVGDVERMLRPLLREDVWLEFSLAENLQKVTADPGQLEQVLMNLLLNARDAMPAGGRIRIETRDADLTGAAAAHRSLQPGRYVFLSVSDTGGGIAEESADQIFEPFFTTKESGKGTGLGLSTAFDIVKQYRGAIWASSVRGQGASFTCCLPAAGAREASPAPLAETGNARTRGTETILLVEDEDSVRIVLTHVLRAHGYSVIEAPNGADALRIFQQRDSEIQLVLTDIVMPIMNGHELAGHIRNIRPGIKILYMSGYPHDMLSSAGTLEKGAVCLQKPLRPAALAARLREALDSPSLPFNPS
jgi:CheY-like chemotaxis protein